MKTQKKMLQIVIVLSIAMLLTGFAVSSFTANQAIHAESSDQTPPELRLALVEASPEPEEKKITICHFPPGNPENPQTIEIAESALDAHRAHGDYIGACKPVPTPTPEPGTTPTQTPKPGETPTPTPLPNLRVDVIAPQPQPATLGDTLYYEFDVINLGDIKDTYRLTLELTPKDATQGKNAVNIGRIPADIALNPGQKTTIATYLELPLQGEFASLTLTLTAQSIADRAIEDSDAVVTALAKSEPAVEFSKTADKRILVPGEVVEYTLKYRNIGNIPLLEVAVEDRLPEQLQFQSSSVPLISQDGQTLRFELHPVLLQGERGEFTITARVRDDIEPRGEIVNRAELSATGLPEPVNADTRASIEVPNLTITKRANQDSVEVGDIVLYTITVSNNGSGTAKNVRILDDLPPVLGYTPGSSVLNDNATTFDPQSSGNGRLTWDVGELKAGEDVTLRYQATVVSGAKSGRYYNAAVVSANDTGGREFVSQPVKLLLTVRQGGVKGMADIEALVFWDKNGNGTLDPAEPGLPDIELLLVRDLLKQKTNQEGRVFFADVKPGEQSVALDERLLPQGFRLTTEASVLLTLTQRDLGYAEFGLQPDWAELTAIAFYDANANGKFDPDEPRLQGIPFVIDNTLELVADQTGTATADRLTPGSHSIMVNESALPQQFVLTTNAFFLVQLRSNAHETRYVGVKLTPGQIRAVAFDDLNANGTQDADEPGIANVTVRLTNGKTLETVTDAKGEAVFASIAPAAYSVHLLPDTLPSGYRPTTELRQALMLAPGETKTVAWPLVRVAEAIVAPTPEPTVTPEPTPTPSPQETPTPTPTMTPEPTPTPESDVCVYTVKAGDLFSKIAAKLTGKSSNYKQIMMFNELTSETLRVGAELRIPKTLLLPEYQECQFEPVGAAEGRVYYDRNANGQYDQGSDIPIPGVTVTIQSDPKTTVTDENGYYRFDNMEPGAHIVWIDPQTLPEPYKPLDNQPIIKIVVQPGGTAATAVADFIVLKASIYEEGVVEGVVCLDLNQNGTCEQTEPGIVGVTVIDPVILDVVVEQTNPGKCVGANDPLPVCTAAGEPLPISLCGSVTFTVTITNTGADAATGMIVTNSMPPGFTPSPQTWTVPGQLAPNAFISHAFTYTADCSVVSGDNATTITYTDTFDGQSYSPPIPNQSFTVVPGAITLTKMATLVNDVPIRDPISNAVILETSEPPAGIGDVITWRIRVASTGYGHVTNAVVTETLDPGLFFTDGMLGSTRTFALSKTDLAPRPGSTTQPPASCLSENWCEDILVKTTVNSCEDLRNNASASWGCGAADCLPPVTAQSSVDFLTRYPYLEYTPPNMDVTVPYCVAGTQTANYTLTIHNSGTGYAEAGAQIAVAIPFDVTIVSSSLNTVPAQSAGVTYDGAQFTIPTRIEADGTPGDTVTINYTISYPRAGSINWCGNTGNNQSGTLYWSPTYEDQCGNTFTPPVESSAYSVTVAAQPKPSVTVTKSCWLHPSGANIAPLISVRYTDQTVRCRIDVTYTGPATCGAGAASDLRVDDDYPNSWTFEGFVNATPPPVYIDYGETDTGTSVWWMIPGGDLHDGANFSYLQEFTIPPMGQDDPPSGIDPDDICQSCGQVWQNTVSVSGADCCGCPLDVPDAVVITNVECENPEGLGLLSERIPPAVTEICKEAVTLTTRYTFTGAGWDSVTWTASNARFTERNDNHMRLEGVPQISMDNGGTWCLLPVGDYTDNTPTGGTLVINDVTTCTGTGNIGNGTTLDVQYDLRASTNSAPQCAAQESFYDYASLEVSGLTIPAGSNYCGGADSLRVDDATLVQINGSAMTVDIEWAVPVPPNGIVGPCGEYDAVITVTKTSAAPAYDAVLFLENANYETLRLTGCSGDFTPTNQTACNGVAPDAATRFAGGYAFSFGDLTGDAGQRATINVHVQGRCFTGDPDLAVHLGYNDGCTDETPNPANLDYAARRCDTAQDRVVGKSLESNVVATKFPEQVFAQWDSATNSYKPAQWTITIVNTGTGSAFNVEVVETLGTDIAYHSSAWDKAYTDIQPYPNSLPPNLPNPLVPINGASYVIKELKPGESRKLIFRATVNGCQDTANNVLVRVRCLDMAMDPNILNPEDEWCDFQTGSSVVKFPPTDLLVTTKFSNPIDTCDVANVVITARNAGLTPIHDVRLNQILPAGLTYQANKTTYWVESSTYGAPPALSEPPLASTWKGVGVTEPGTPIPAGYGDTLNPPKDPPLAGSSSYYWGADSPNFAGYGADLRNALSTLNPGETIYIAFQVYVDCVFPQGDLRFYAAFDKCGATTLASSAESLFRVTPNKPIISIAKNPQDQTISCGSQAEWIIDVTNSAKGTAGLPVPARYLRITDTWGGAYTLVSFDHWDKITNDWVPYPTTLPGATDSITWEMFDLQPGPANAERFRLRATFDDCDGTFENIVTAELRCLLPGVTPDNDPATVEGGCLICRSLDPDLDPDGSCPLPTPANATHEQPDLRAVPAATTANACTDFVPITVTLTNAAAVAVLYDLDLDIMFPPTGVTFVNNPTYPVTVDGATVVPVQLTNAGGDVVGLQFYDGTTAPTNLPPLLPHATNPDSEIVIQFYVNVACNASGDFTVVPRYEDCCNDNRARPPIPLGITWPEPLVRVEKTTDPITYGCGQDVAWTIRVFNDGPTQAELVRVRDTYGVGLTPDAEGDGLGDDFYQGTPNDMPYAVWDATNRTIDWTIENLPGTTTPPCLAGQPCSREYRLITQLGSGAACTGSNRENHVEATWYCTASNPPDGNPATPETANCDGDTNTRIGNVNVEPNVTADATIDLSTLSYCALSKPVTVTIQTDPTSNTLYNLDVTLTLPTRPTYDGDAAFYAPASDAFNVTAVPALLPAGNLKTNAPVPHGATTHTFRVADSVPPGTTITITFNVSSSCFNSGQITTQLAYDDCCLNHYTPAAVPSDPITPEYPNLAMSVTPAVVLPGTEPPLRGDTVNYTITVTNAGLATATYARISSHLNSWLQFQSAVAPTITQTGGGGSSSPAGWDDDGGNPCHDNANTSAVGQTNGTLWWDVRELKPGGVWQTTVTTTFNPPLGEECLPTNLLLEATAGYDCPIDVVGWTFDNLACTEEAPAACPLRLITPVQNTLTNYCSSIGDLVWHDLDGDGVQDAGEAVISGVTVRLLDNAGNVLATTATDLSGNYSFARLTPGDYAIRFVPPAGYFVSPRDQDDTNPNPDERDSDANPDTASPIYGSTAVTTLAPNEHDMTWDAGLYTRVNIGNLVWHDLNNDGVYDADGIDNTVGNTDDELGIPGVRVELYRTYDNGVTLIPAIDVDGNPNWFIDTDGNGNYNFINLPPGDYVVVVPTPPAAYPTSSFPTETADQGLSNDDSDDMGSQTVSSGATQSPVITLISGGEVDDDVDTDGTSGDLTVDFGFFHPVSIGNYVWLDSDAMGDQDATELGIPGVTVQLEWWNGISWVQARDITNTPVPPDTTDSDGLYEFLNLPPGDYHVVIPATNWTSGVFSPGQPYAGALGSPGGSDGLDNRINTDDNGNNDGTAASAGVYSGSINLQSGQEPLNDGDTHTGNNSSSDYTIDFGFYQPVNLGNYIWYDADGDGQQDATEHGIAGMRVELFTTTDGGTTLILARDVTGADVPPQTTLANGFYNFTNLPPSNTTIGDYVVRVTPPDATYFLTVTGADSDADTNPSNTDSNGILSAGVIVSRPVTLTSREEPLNDGDTNVNNDSNSNLTVDFGFVRYDYGDLPDNVPNYPDYPTYNASTGAYHLIDEVTYLGNGVDAETDGQPNLTATGDGSDEDGVVFLDPILPSQPGEPYQYQIKVTASQAGYLNAWIDFDGLGFGAGDKITPDGVGSADNIPLHAGENLLTFTAPESATLFATTLYSRFRFTAEETDGGVTPTGLARSGEVEDYALMSLGNQLWFDNGNDGSGNFVLANSNNGHFDSGEEGVPDGVEVWLYREGEIVGSMPPFATTTTSNDGHYLFTGLPPGNYFVHIPSSQFSASGALNGYISSTGAVDPDNNVNDDADENGIDEDNIDTTPDTPDQAGVSSGVITLSLGDEPDGGANGSDGDADANSNLTVDFGFIPVPILHVMKGTTFSSIQPCVIGDNPNTPQNEEPLTYTITIENTGEPNAAMRLVSITDELDLGWYVVSSTTAGLPDGISVSGPMAGATGTLEWTFSDADSTPGAILIPIPPIGSSPIMITLRIAANSTVERPDPLLDLCDARYQFENAVEVEAYDQRDRSLVFDDDSEPIADAVSVDCPALHVVTEATPTGDLEPCRDITYTITIDNNTGGPASTLEDIRVNDALPANFRVTAMNVTRNGAILTRDVDYAAYFTSPTTPPFTGVPFDGPATLEWFFGANAPNGATVPRPVSLPPNEKIVITITGQFTEGACGTSYTPTIIASAGADLCGLPKEPTSDSVLALPTTNIVCPTVSLTKTLNTPSPVMPGQLVKYTINAVNNGPASSYLYDVEVTDTLPAGWKLVSSNATGASGSAPAPGSTGTLTWTFSGQALRGGEHLLITLEVVADASVCGSAAFCNEASLTAKTSCGSTLDAQAVSPAPCMAVVCPTPTPTPSPESDMTPTPGAPDVAPLQIEKSVNTASAQPGDILEYTIIVTNPTDSAATNVVVHDTLPKGLTYLADSATVGGVRLSGVRSENGQLYFDIFEIPANGSAVITYAVTVQAGSGAGRYINVAEIVGGAQDDAVIQIGGDGSRRGDIIGKRRADITDAKPCTVIPAEFDKPWFITDIAMYAASELYDTGSPFIHWSEANGLTVDQQFLSPTGVREFGAEISKFSQDNVSTVMMNSGIGLHLKYAPLIVAGAKAQGVSPETYLEDRLQRYAQQSNLKVVPRSMFPIFLEYAEGDPRYANAVDINNWATLLWDAQSFDTNIIPSAIGQSLRRQVLLLGDALATNHDQDGARRDDGQFSGVDDARGFIGLLAADSVANKLFVMANALLQTTETTSGETVRYFPYRTHVDATTLADAQPNVTVVDATSRLFDQASLLWALSDLMLLMEHEGAAQQAFSNNLLAPDVDWAALPQTFEVTMTDVSSATLHAMAERLAGIAFATIERFHYDQESGRLRDSAFVKGEQTGERERISTTSSALTLTALARYHAALRHDAAAQAQIAALIRSAADALMKEAYDNEHGGLFSDNTDNPTKTLQAQMAGIRGLLAAYDITQEPRDRAAAFAVYDFAEKSLWNEDLALYKDREERGLYAYTPLDLGATTGALRELIYHAETTEQTLEMTARMKNFVKQIAKHAGLQLSEVMTGGEQYLMPIDHVSSIRTAQSLDSPFGLAPVFGSEIRLNRDAITALHTKRPTDSCEQAQSSMRSVYYLTDLGMYAATEFGLNAETLATADEQNDQAELGERNRNPELLNLGALERTAQKAADFSDENLVHIQTKSALGVALKHAPLIRKQAKAQGIAPEAVVDSLLKQYAELTGLDAIPERLQPIFIEFEGGVPEIEYGKETERWFESGMDRSIVPSALGQTLRRQTMWLKTALSARHDDANRIAADGTFIGRNAEEGFLGLLIAQEAANKIVFLHETLRKPLAGEQGTYFPHRLEIEFDGDAPKAYRVADRDSVLFDQVSLLWGISEFYGLVRSKNGAPYTELFGTGKLISGKYEEMTRELVGLLLKNMTRFHWNEQYGAFYETYSMESAKDAPQEQVISTQQIAMSAMALESVIRNFGASAKVSKQAMMLLSAQTEFLYRHLYRAEDGAVFNGASLTKDKIEPFDGLKTLAAHSAAVRSFLIAYRLTKNEDYLAAAKRSFEFLDRTFWDARLEVYKSAIGQYQYTPLNVAMTVGAFRELLAVDQTAFIERLNEHFAKFFDSVVERVGLQLSEQQYFLELAVEPKTLAPVFASDLLIQPVGSAADMNVPQPGATLRYVITLAEDELPCDGNEAYIEDMLPPNVTFAQSVPVPMSVNDRVIRWRVGDLSPDRDGLYRITVDARVNADSMMTALGLDQGDMAAGIRGERIKNCASFQCSSIRTGDVPLDSACVEDRMRKPQLGIEKSLRSVTAEPGKEAEFEVVITNLSEVTAYTLVVEDANPAGFIYVPSSVRSSDVPDVKTDDVEPLVWVLEDLAPGKSVRFTYRVALDSRLEAGAYLSLVKVYALDRAGFPFESNEFEFTIDVQRDVVLQVSQQFGDEEPVAALRTGEAIPLMTSIENVGTDSILDASVVLTLPDGLRAAPKTSRLNGVAIGEPERAGNTLTWKIGELPPGVKKTLLIDVVGELPGTFKMTTMIRGVTEKNASYQSKSYGLAAEVVK